jgi:hypothetical protein
LILLESSRGRFLALSHQHRILDRNDVVRQQNLFVCEICSQRCIVLVIVVLSQLGILRFSLVLYSIALVALYAIEVCHRRNYIVEGLLCELLPTFRVRHSYFFRLWVYVLDGITFRLGRVLLGRLIVLRRAETGAQVILLQTGAVD